MTEKRSMTKKFLSYIEENNMVCKYSLIEDSDLYDSILDDVNESKKLFEDLKSMNIILYEISNAL